MKNFSYTFLVISVFMVGKLNAQVTWSDDIACIVYNKCTSCHNPAGVAPFSLMNYSQAFSFRYSIKSATSARRMPPWGADSEQIQFVDDISLTQEEIDLIAEWVDSNAPEGDNNLAPEPPVFDNVETIVDPDVVIQFQEYTSMADEEDDFRCFVEPWTATNFNWITGMEVVPGNTNIVHHSIFSWDETDTAITLDEADSGVGYYCFGDNGSESSFNIGGWTPGSGASILPDGFGFQLPPGGNIIIQTHFPEGSIGESDASKINFQFSDDFNLRSIDGGPIINHFETLTNGPLFIPANTVKTFYAQATISQTLTMLDVNPHMHLIGSAIKAYAVTPDGDTLHLIDIPHWDFDWQYTYRYKHPIVIPEGSTIYGETVYDNTTNNLVNPNNPPQDVSVGEETGDEMFLIYFTWAAYQAGDENMLIADRPPLVDCGQIVNNYEPIFEQLVRVYPNPSSDWVRLSFDGTLSGEIQIFDTSGKLVRSVGKVKLPVNISVHDLPKGLYLLKFKNGSVHFVKKIMID